MLDHWPAIAAAFFVAGLVKGIVGLGLPSVAIGLLSVMVGLKPALALLLMPALVTNVLQALVGGALGMIVRRTWPLLVMIFAGAAIGVALLVRLDGRIMSVVLGATLMAYAAMGMWRPVLPHPGRYELWLSLPVGVVHGVVSGMTGSYIPAVPFLQSLGWGKDVMIQAMGVLFTVSTLAVGLALADQRLLSPELGVASALAAVPALAGMWAGQLVRGRLSEQRFRQALLAALGWLGAYIVWRAAGA